MTCTATLTTAVVEDGELIVFHLACNRNTPYVGHRHSRTDDEPWFAEWGDDTPGATPHTESTALHRAAQAVQSITSVHWDVSLTIAKAALDAVADPEHVWETNEHSADNRHTARKDTP